MSTEKLTLKTKLAFGIGATGEGVTNWVFAGLTFFFYNQVLGLSGSLTGLAVLIAIIFDAISDPVMGSISDRYVSKLGRRHPFMLAAFNESDTSNLGSPTGPSVIADLSIV